jgi:hypothetical protein
MQQRLVLTLSEPTSLVLQDFTKFFSKYEDKIDRENIKFGLAVPLTK